MEGGAARDPRDGEDEGERQSGCGAEGAEQSFANVKAMAWAPAAAPRTGHPTVREPREHQQIQRRDAEDGRIRERAHEPLETVYRLKRLSHELDPSDQYSHPHLRDQAPDRAGGQRLRVHDRGPDAERARVLLAYHEGIARAPEQ